jgi:hypothetical protein
MAVPAEQDLVTTRGDTLTADVTIFGSDGTTPINITGRTYTSMVRLNYDDVSPAATFTCTVTNGSAGELQMVMSAASTAVLRAGNYYWDLQENASGIITTILAGAFVVLPDVTRS